MTGTRWRRAGILLVAIPAALWCVSGVAVAHVTVQPTTAVAGTEATLTFTVPNEKDHASTVKIVLALPTDKPIPAVSLQPVSGWAARPTSRDLPRPVQTDDGPITKIVARITWSAADRASAIAPGQFQQFTIEAGPLPDAERLIFKVLQYYSDGSVVRWIDRPARGAEPAHPAPVLTIRSDADPAANRPDPGPDAGWIAVAAFVAGLLGFAAGAAALVLVRRDR